MNSNWEVKNNIRYETSLMVSYENLNELKSFAIKFRGTRKFLSHLVKNHNKVLKFVKKSQNKVLTQYQEKGLKLKKVNFMPESRDWLFLKDIAFHYGISISLLFSIIFKEFLKSRDKFLEENQKENIVHVLKLKILRELIFEQQSLDNYLQISTLKI